MKQNSPALTRQGARLSGFSSLAVLAAGTAMLLAISGCVQNSGGRSASASRLGGHLYLVHFTASRSRGQLALASVTVPVHLDRLAVVKTDFTQPTEDRPALPVFAATLTTTGTRGVFQLVTKVAIREAARNKKGKLKTSKRNQGALLPIRLDQAESASPDGDPIQIAVRVEAR